MQQAWLGRVQPCIESRSPSPLVDSSARALHAAKEPVRIDSPAPRDLSSGVIFSRPFPFNHGFCLAVTHLLLPKSSQSTATVMQDHSGRIETQSPASLLNAPASVDVVPSNVELGIETTNGLQPVSPECHVAPRDVLSLLIGEQYVSGPARRMSDACSHLAIVRKRDIRATYAGGVGPPKRQCQIAEPVRVRRCVIVNVRDNFSSCSMQAQIPRVA